MKMTNKQALENIKSRINSLSLFPKVDRKTYDESWEIIEKDLEVLQILKDKLPHITTLRVMEYESFYMLYNSINCTGITKEEYELLKEWLKDDNTYR